MANTTNFKFLSNFRHGYTDISSEMFWGGGFHHQLEQSIASSPHELCMEKFCEISMAQILWSEVWNTQLQVMTSPMRRSLGYIHSQTHSRWTFKKSDSKLLLPDFDGTWSGPLARLKSFKMNSYSITSFWGEWFPLVLTCSRHISGFNPSKSFQKVLHLRSRSHKLHQDLLKLSEKSTS